MATPNLLTLLNQIRQCTECESHLPHGARPVLSASTKAKVLIIGQAPGRRVHESGIPWDDPSGERLREWMGVSRTEFYDETKFAIVPMGFCYPGTGASGDLPPRKECAELWHEQLFAQLDQIKFTLLIGQYAQRYRLAEKRKSTLTETVRSWKDFTPANLPLPHPSPRNNRWLKQNPWLEKEVVPYLRRRIKKLIN